MTPNVQQILGMRVRAYRRAADLSKVDFALQMGISRVSLDLIEGGRSNIKLSTLNKMAEHMGLEAWQLICPEDTLRR